MRKKICDCGDKCNCRRVQSFDKEFNTTDDLDIDLMTEFSEK